MDEDLTEAVLHRPGRVQQDGRASDRHHQVCAAVADGEEAWLLDHEPKAQDGLLDLHWIPLAHSAAGTTMARKARLKAVSPNGSVPDSRTKFRSTELGPLTGFVVNPLMSYQGATVLPKAATASHGCPAMEMFASQRVVALPPSKRA